MLTNLTSLAAPLTLPKRCATICVISRPSRPNHENLRHRNQRQRSHHRRRLLDNQALTHVALATKKIALDDDDEAANVKAFAAQVKAFVQENAIERIAIKKRSKKGEFAGGPTTFKIEGVFSCWTGLR